MTCNEKINRQRNKLIPFSFIFWYRRLYRLPTVIISLIVYSSYRLICTRQQYRRFVAEDSYMRVIQQNYVRTTSIESNDQYWSPASINYRLYSLYWTARRSFHRRRRRTDGRTTLLGHDCRRYCVTVTSSARHLVIPFPVVYCYPYTVVLINVSIIPLT